MLHRVAEVDIVQGMRKQIESPMTGTQIEALATFPMLTVSVVSSRQ